MANGVELLSAWSKGTLNKDRQLGNVGTPRIERSLPGWRFFKKQPPGHRKRSCKTRRKITSLHIGNLSNVTLNNGYTAVVEQAS